MEFMLGFRCFWQFWPFSRRPTEDFSVPTLKPSRIDRYMLGTPRFVFLIFFGRFAWLH